MRLNTLKGGGAALFEWGKPVQLDDTACERWFKPDGQESDILVDAEDQTFETRDISNRCAPPQSSQDPVYECMIRKYDRVNR
jgi:hypothetical protein